MITSKVLSVKVWNSPNFMNNNLHKWFCGLLKLQFEHVRVCSAARLLSAGGETVTEEIPFIRTSDTSSTWGRLSPGGRFDSFLSLHYGFHWKADAKVNCTLYSVFVCQGFISGIFLPSLLVYANNSCCVSFHCNIGRHILAKCFPWDKNTHIIQKWRDKTGTARFHQVA